MINRKLLLSLALIVLSASTAITKHAWDAGWEAGWTEGWEIERGGYAPFPPFAPFAPIGYDTYQDGFTQGVLAGARAAQCGY